MADRPRAIREAVVITDDPENEFVFARGLRFDGKEWLVPEGTTVKAEISGVTDGLPLQITVTFFASSLRFEALPKEAANG